MKRIILALMLAGTLLAACSTAPQEGQTTPHLPGVIDLADYAGFEEAMIFYYCFEDNAEITKRQHIQNLGEATELDLDTYRPECSGEVFGAKGWLPKEVVESATPPITGSVVETIMLAKFNEPNPAEIIELAPKVSQGYYPVLIFFANSGGTWKYSGYPA